MAHQSQNEDVGSEERDDLQYVTNLRNRIDGEVQELRQTLEETRNALNRKQKQLEHLDRFLESSTDNTENSPQETTTPSHRTNWAMVKDIAEEILRKRNGEHIHFRDLYEELKRQGVVINVKNPRTGLAVAFAKDKGQRFVRSNRRGYYALREDHPGASNVGRQRSQATPADGNGEAPANE